MTSEMSGGGGSLGPISEAQLALLWRRRAARSRALRTEGGRRVLVLYPGRPGVTAGPDFRNALLLVEGAGLVQGDVELHLRQGDWRAHGHHSDPNYNGVALHAALYPDAGRAAHTDGGAVPPVEVCGVWWMRPAAGTVTAGTAPAGTAMAGTMPAPMLPGTGMAALMLMRMAGCGRGFGGCWRGAGIGVRRVGSRWRRC